MGQASDSLDAEGGRWLVLPFASYAPETKLAGGMVTGWYETPTGSVRPSSIQALITATQRRQVVLQIAPEWYVADGRWRLSGEGRIREFPNSFFGVGGDTPQAAEEPYTVRSLYLDAAAHHRVGTHWRLGGRLVTYTSTISDTEAASVLGEQIIPGADGTTAIGIGPALVADTRANRYFPRHGAFVDASFVWYSTAWGSESPFARWMGDLRMYRSMGGVVLAANLYTEAVLGTTPFELLPELGGATHMRGYRQGRFRDNVYWTTQMEVRLPLFWRFRMTAFASVGEVGPRLGSDVLNAIQGAVGLGGRLRLTEDGVYGRADVAYGATGLQLYLSLGEAF